MNLKSLLKNKKNISFFTTPSHAGKLCIIHKFYQWYKSDISEVEAYEPNVLLQKSEKWASKIYGTKYTKYLTNGSTSGLICAVITALKNKKILIWNKAHQCHRNAAELAGCNIVEYEQELNTEWDVYIPLSPQKVEKLLLEHKPDGIIITSPSYEGFVTDIKSISEICKRNNVILIVDEAHGALYPFSDKLPESAVKYADYTVQSLHKTAGGINPTALLHSNHLEPRLSLINTSSPSYPMLMTIEANIKFLNSAKGKNCLDKLIKSIEELRKIDNVKFGGEDITKILIKKDGYSGIELSEKLFDKYKIEDERTNSKSTLLLTGIGTTTKKLERLKKALKSL